MPHLHDLPRVALAHLPTPLEPAPRLSAALGGPAIWFKRDDCTGLATGGNKTRKLEFLLAEARARGADTVLTFGALQSNHARQTAAACARLGLACELVLGRRVDYQGEAYEHAGNLLLDDLCGARVHQVAPADSAAFAEQLRARLGAAGHRVYVIPAGGSNATGALGYVACAAETGKLLLVQLAEIKVQSKGRGLILMGLDKGDRLAAVLLSSRPELLVLGVGRGGKEKEVLLRPRDMGHYAGHRAQKGRVLPDRIRPTALRIPPEAPPR